MLKVYISCNWIKDIKKTYDVIKQLTPHNSGIFGNFCMTKNKKEADIVVILEDTAEDMSGFKGTIICFPCEPPVIRKVKRYFKLFPQHAFTYDNIHHITYSFEQVGGNMDYWSNLKYSDTNKNKLLSAIISGKKHTNYARLRLELLKLIINKRIDIDLYGRNLPYQNKGFIEQKKDALLNYHYSLAFENCSIPNYFTEKFTDCILCWTIPIYCGCTNISTYFPKNSYYLIDICKPETAVQQIMDIVTRPITEKNIEALQIARHKILYEYSLFPTLENLSCIKTGINKNGE